MSKLNVVVRLLTLALLGAAMVMTTSAQTNTAKLLGIVTDPSGAVVAGATITVTNVNTQVRRVTVTNTAGAYEVPLLTVGTYSIVAEQSGFKRVERSGIELVADQRVKLDFVLEVGNVTESIEVTEAAPLVATQTVERGIVIQSNQVENLPLNGRNFANLITLQPGVVLGGQTAGSITFNGLPFETATINIDGTDAANPDWPKTADFGGQTRLNMLSQEFIQEFKSTQGVYSAEMGRALGGSINVITKSGTNELHGSVFEFVRNDVFDARSFFASTRDPLRLNQFGVTAGGPIIKDKLFFFGGWEGARERRAQQITGIVPTPLLREEMVAANPAYKQLVDLLPLPTEPLEGDIYRGFHRRSDARKGREDVFQGRLDFAPTTRDTIFARYTIFDSTVTSPDLMPTNALTYPSQDRSATLSWTHALGPQSINELRLGANKQDIPRSYAAFIPDAIGTLNGFLNTSDLEFLRASGGSWTILDNFSHTVGRHSLKAGVEAQRYHYGRANSQAPIYQMDTVEDILNSTPETATINLTVDPIQTRTQTTRWGVFAQDDFRVNANLTLSLGLRWEYYTPVTEANGNAFNVVDSPYGPFRAKGEPIWNADHNNFGPRFGLSWDMGGNGKNVIRMGGGVFYADEAHRQVSVLATAIDKPAFIVVDAADFADLRYPVSARNFDPSQFSDQIPVSRNLENPNHRTSYSEQWSLDYQRQIARNWAFTAGYLGDRGLKLQQVQYLNQRNADGQRLVPDIGQIRWVSDEGMTTYHSMQLALKKRFSSGFRLDGYYTWSKAIVNGAGSQESINWGQDPNDLRASRSRTTLSQEHVFSLNYSWDLPFDRWLSANSGGFAKHFLGGWSVNGIITAASGFPRNIESGKDNFGSGWASGQRPNYVAGQDIRAGTDYQTSPKHTFVNRDAFTPNTHGQYGNLGAYVLTGPGNQVWDFSIFKNNQIKERMRLQFRAEFFNVFNHTNWGGPNTNLNSGNFGNITGTGAARQIQFGLKLLF
jgi:Carboxypeptidase regulatory-like domain/TonB dependent receptor-like, beta-barrel